VEATPRNLYGVYTMSFFDFLRKKESAAGKAISMFVAGQAVYTPRNYEAITKEGYFRNLIAFRCINLIASSAATVDWMVQNKSGEITTHPLISLMAKLPLAEPDELLPPVPAVPWKPEPEKPDAD
jgi:hypothetical protein